MMNDIKNLTLDERLLASRLKELLDGAKYKTQEPVQKITMEEYLKQVDEYWKPETDPGK